METIETIPYPNTEPHGDEEISAWVAILPLNKPRTAHALLAILDLQEWYFGNHPEDTD